MYDNIEQVKKWFENDANIKRLKLNRQRVIEIIKESKVYMVQVKHYPCWSPDI